MSTTIETSIEAVTNAVRAEIVASIGAKQAMLDDERLLARVAELAAQCVESLRAGGKIIFAGNGGSFSDAQHLSAELTSRLRFDRLPLPSLALGTNSSAMSAIANDYGYDQVFARELEAIATPNDVFLPLTTSGNSPNILAAIAVASGRGIPTVGFTNASGGAMRDRCDCLCVPTAETARVQECHILLGHILCGLIEHSYFRGSDAR